MQRIQFLTYQGQRVLLVDLSHCTATEVQDTVRAVPEFLGAEPRGSVLILSDFTGASFDEESLRVMKETAVFDKPYIKKSAWVGAENFPTAFSQSIEGYSRRKFPAFKSRDEALAWLVKS
jgi:hypothetical protein